MFNPKVIKQAPNYDSERDTDLNRGPVQLSSRSRPHIPIRHDEVPTSAKPEVPGLTTSEDQSSMGPRLPTDKDQPKSPTCHDVLYNEMPGAYPMSNHGNAALSINDVLANKPTNIDHPMPGVYPTSDQLFLHPINEMRRDPEPALVSGANMTPGFNALEAHLIREAAHPGISRYRLDCVEVPTLEQLYPNKRIIHLGAIQTHVSPRWSE